ncbi:hypothetical protein T7987_12610 [Sulfitobacter faviae]|uniref:Uncharacterized protein n=1 Tax=Sulfitobacter faviae TaxID=1775881 RepID=A0ABZ0V0R5_9RHOB|nr:hypothetical protein [Sulfitobacter faviae]WPZ21010.1 hypothetical protein T7987_12610 [Sulfitobacter faviae]
MTIHFAADFPGLGICVVSDTAVSTLEDGVSRQRKGTAHKIFFANRGSGVVVAAAGNGDLCNSTLLSFDRAEQPICTPEGAASWMQNAFPDFSNGRGAEFIVAGRDPNRDGEFQIAVLRSRPSTHRNLSIVPETKDHATIGFQAPIFNSEFCGYLRANIDRIYSLSFAVPEKIWSKVSDSREGFGLGIIGGALIGVAQDVVSENRWEEMIGGPWTATCIPLSGQIFQTSGEMYNGATIRTGAHINALAGKS